jgi:hypothetical protein
VQERSEATDDHAGSREEVEETFNEFYERVAMTCFRYLDFKSLEQVNNITPYEYRLLMKSKELEMVDEEYRIHLQAYLNMSAQAKKRTGKKVKPVYTTFNKFYNYQKSLDRVMGIKKKSKFDGLAQFIKEQKKEG